MRAAFLNSTLDRRAGARRRARADARRARSALRRARAPDARRASWRSSIAARARPARAVRDRRGALRVRSGATTSAPNTCSSRVLHERYPDVPRIALTATADALTRADIVERLQLGEARVVRRQLRPAEHPLPHRREGRRAHAAAATSSRDEHAGDAGIVYCLSRKKVDETADVAARRGHRRAALPRRPRRRRARSATRTASCARTAS